MTDKKTPPTLCPNPHDREQLAEDAERLDNLMAFVDAWRDEFEEGPTKRGSLMITPLWLHRLLWIRDRWTAPELRAAFRETRDAVPRRPWFYFVSLLEQMAAGTFEPSDRERRKSSPGLAPSRNTYHEDDDELVDRFLAMFAAAEVSGGSDD